MGGKLQLRNYHTSYLIIRFRTYISYEMQSSDRLNIVSICLFYVIYLNKMHWSSYVKAILYPDFYAVYIAYKLSF